MQRQIFGLTFGLWALVAGLSFPASAQPPDKPVVISAPERPPAPVSRPHIPEEFFARRASTPEQAVGSFALFALTEARGNFDFGSAAQFVADKEADAQAYRELAEELKKARGTSHLSVIVDKVEVDDKNGKASITVKVILRNPLEMVVSQQEHLSLRREKTNWGDVWKLIPDELAIFRYEEGYVQLLVNYVAYPKRTLSAMRVGHSLKQAKGIGMGIRMLAQDSDGKIALTPETLKDKIEPYSTSEAIFTAPKDEPGTQSYNLNPRLANQSLWKIQNPAELVMVYLGRDEKLDFRYDGKTVIGFADGHIELVDEERAKTLRWKP